MTFTNRTQAAEDLVKQLEQYRGKNPLVLGIPRGAVLMAKIIADELKGDLDVALVHKIGAPENPEFAIGSVSEFGTIYCSQAVERYGIPSKYVDSAAEIEIAKLRERRKDYSPIHQPIDPKNRIVIIVDDGIATGSTMLAAVRAVRKQGAKRVVVATPVASLSAINSLESEVDELAILEAPENFYSISQFYDEFPQVSDEEVLSALSDTRKSRRRNAA